MPQRFVRRRRSHGTEHGIGESPVRFVGDASDAVWVEAGKVLLDGLLHRDISHVRTPSRWSCAMFWMNDDSASGGTRKHQPDCVKTLTPISSGKLHIISMLRLTRRMLTSLE